MDLLKVDEAALPELDVRSEAFLNDPNATLREARRHGPLARSHRGIEVLSFDVCSAIFSSDAFETLGTEHFRDIGAPDVLVDFVEHGLLLNTNRERHDRVRRVMSRAFSIRQIDEQRQVMHDVASRLVESLLCTDHADLVALFTEPYPMEVLCLVLGVPPQDIPSFHRAAIDLHLLGAVPLAPQFSRLEAALSELWEYVHVLVERRKVDPREDFISALIAAQADEARLTDDEVVWNLVNLLFAGQDTTRYQLASAVRVLAKVPGLWDQMAGAPERVPASLEEAMRLRPVSQFVVRRPPSAAVAAGLAFPAGRRVILNLLAASRDPDTFPEPERFAADRQATYGLPFGWGLHFCLGQALARTEMCEAIAVLTHKSTTPHELAAREASAAAMLGGPESLTMTFSRR